MKDRTLLLICTGLVIATVLASTMKRGNGAPLMGRPKWEYKVWEAEIYGMGEATAEQRGFDSQRLGYAIEWQGTPIFTSFEQLNKLGKEGWEVVSVFTETETVYPGRANTRTKAVKMLLKRSL